MEPPAPAVPLFGLFAASTTLAYSTFGASIPLLPLLLPAGSSILHSSIVLVAFIIPALFVYPIVTSKQASPALGLVLVAAAFFEALGPLILASVVTCFTVLYDGEPRVEPYTWLVRQPVEIRPGTALSIITFAMFVSGLGASMSQFGLVRLISERMETLPLSLRRQKIGIHLAVLEACIAIGAILSPMAFALLAKTRESVYIPYALSGISQLVLAVYVSIVLPEYELEISGPKWGDGIGFAAAAIADGSARGYGTVREAGNPPRKEAARRSYDGEEESESDPGVLHALRHPWVWMILFSMFVAAASASFLRPVLTPRITDDMNGSRMLAASLFSLCALVGVMSESVASTVVSAKLGVRNTIVLGLIVCLIGFRVLLHHSFTVPAIVLLMAGSSSSLVMTLTDLSQTTRVVVHGITNSLSLLAAFTFSLGEIFGTLAAGYLADTSGSIEVAVLKWSRFLLVSCCIVGMPYVVGVVLQCLQPWMFIVQSPRSVHTPSTERSTSPLPDLWSGEV